MVEGTVVLWVSWAIDLAGGIDVPLAINTLMSEMVALETGLRVLWMISVKWTVY